MQDSNAVVGAMGTIAAAGATSLSLSLRLRLTVWCDLLFHFFQGECKGERETFGGASGRVQATKVCIYCRLRGRNGAKPKEQEDEKEPAVGSLGNRSTHIS